MEIFVARQPIFDRHQKVQGYELLFRNGPSATGFSGNANQASLQIIAECPTLVGPEGLANGHPVFINITRELLLAGSASLLPPRECVIEILEDVAPDSRAVDECRRLKDAGYRIALDDFGIRHRRSPLLSFAQFVKIDFLATDAEQRRLLARELGGRELRLLAEKVETPAQVAEATELGFELFQGFFFSRPTIQSSRSVPGIKLHYLRILGLVRRASLDHSLIEEIVKQDVSLSFRLLRQLGMAQYGLRQPVHSIRHALLVMGEREFRRWVTVVVLANLAADQPQELVVQTLIRARLCERMASAVGMSAASDDAFFMGMLSLVDVMIGRPLAELLTQVPVSDEVQDALLGRPGSLLQVLEYVKAWERADWERTLTLARELRLDESQMPAWIAEALKYGHAAETQQRKAA